jgi:Family of unknown function (DUF6496)
MMIAQITFGPRIFPLLRRARASIFGEQLPVAFQRRKRREHIMPEKETLKRVAEDKREGKSPTTQAGEFVREEMHHIREGKHGARNAKQAIAIGLSKARRAGVMLPPPKRGKTSERSRRSAELAYEEGQGKRKPRSPSKKRSRAIHKVLEHEGKSAASHKALSRQAHSAARQRTAAGRHEAAMKAVRTKGSEGLSRAAKKAARTRERER